MKAFQLRSHVGSDGMLKVEVPVPATDEDVDVVIVVSRAPQRSGAGAWPPGFFDETFGCLKDAPLERDPQGTCEQREPMV